jgi:hypothetical protein
MATILIGRGPHRAPLLARQQHGIYTLQSVRRRAFEPRVFPAESVSLLA